MDVVPNWYGGGVDVEGREDMDDDDVNVEASGVDVDDGSISGVSGLVVVDVDSGGGVDVDDVTDDVCGCNAVEDGGNDEGDEEGLDGKKGFICTLSVPFSFSGPGEQLESYMTELWKMARSKRTKIQESPLH